MSERDRDLNAAANFAAMLIGLCLLVSAVFVVWAIVHNPIRRELGEHDTFPSRP